MAKPKLHPQTAITGELGTALIGRYVLRMGHAWNPTSMDAGIDGTIELCRPDTREALNQIVLVQSKATLGGFPGETEQRFEWSCDERDIDYWMKGNAPVILIVVRAIPDSEEAYWVDAKRYFSDPATRRERRVKFDKRRDRFDETCSEALLPLAAPEAAGLYLAPPPRAEVLHSNLLIVDSHAPNIFVADTEFRNPGAIWDYFREQGINPGCEWILKGERILSFRDLDSAAFRGVCDPGTIEQHDAADWARSDDTGRHQEFVWLLKQALQARISLLDMRYDKNENHYYFKAPPRLASRDVSYRSREKLTARKVFEPYPMKTDSSRIAYYRHSAFRGGFRSFDDCWFLEITPTYRFTSDGFRVHPFSGEYLKKIKEIERNNAVSGQVVM